MTARERMLFAHQKAAMLLLTDCLDMWCTSLFFFFCKKLHCLRKESAMAMEEKRDILS